MTNWQLIKRTWTRANQSAGELSRLKWITAVLGSAATAYVLGGVVLALRLEQANFPVQDGLNVIPRSTMLLTGIRELIITVFVGMVLLLVVLGWGALLRWAFSLREEIGIGIGIALLMLFVPLNAAGLSWPVAILVLSGGAYFAKREAKDEDDWAPSLTVALILVIGTIVAVTLARYTSPPYQFAYGEVLLRTEPGAKEAETYEGGYLGGDSNYVYLAYRDDPKLRGRSETIVAYARDDIAQVILRPPPPPKDAPASLASQLLGIEFSATPQGDAWSNGEYKSWWRLFR